MKCLWTMLLVICSAVVFAVETPQAEEGAEEFDATLCIKQYKDICINEVCMTSEDIDCEDKCAALARDKCQAQ